MFEFICSNYFSFVFIKKPILEPTFSSEYTKILSIGPNFKILPINWTNYLQILKPRPIPSLFCPLLLSKVAYSPKSFFILFIKFTFLYLFHCHDPTLPPINIHENP